MRLVRFSRCPRHKGQREHGLTVFTKAYDLDLSARLSIRGWPQKTLSSEEAVLSLSPSPPLSKGSHVVPGTLTLLLPAAFLEQRFPPPVLLGPLEPAPGSVPASQPRLPEGCWLRGSLDFYGLSSFTTAFFAYTTLGLSCLKVVIR